MSARPPPPRVAGLEPTLPSSWYTSERVFALEKQRIFCRDWICVAREEELAEKGAWRVLDVAGESLLLLRTPKGKLRAFYNVCRHRGTRLCRDPLDPAAPAPLHGGIAAGRITCPYHQWSYDFDGHLVAAPHLSAEPGFDKSQFSLYPAAIECWGGFVFLNLSPATAPPLGAQLAGIPERLGRYPLAQLRIGHTIRYSVAANWKALCENYNECYHCAGLHPELCAVVPAFRERGGANLDWARGIPHRPGAYTFTVSGATRRRAFPTLNEDERVRHKGELAYPNLFLSLACDHVAVFILKPRSAARTDIVCQFLFEPYEMEKGDFDPRDATEFWDLVNRQDWAICEAVQQGISARVHERGYYAPMEDFNLDIRRYVLDRIGDAVEDS
ncbi:MAG TPA: aromatic ring-hydroxylating dioxygenase subunit alpha [Steroidobacteraceae bacterium]|nr:aromatic ring-hydroxylating dioxygenase subunit alpha [Steroidobacteraceae bacterium]